VDRIELNVILCVLRVVENSPVDLVATLYMENGAFGGVVWQGQVPAAVSWH